MRNLLMNSFNQRWLIPGIVIMTFMISGCDKQDETDIDATGEFSETFDNEVVDGYFEDTDDIVFEMNDGTNFTNGRISRDDNAISRCAEVTHDTDNKTITVDFGEGCEGPGGKIRSGKIIITYTDRKNVAGSIWVYTLEDFTVNGIELEGTKTITNITEEEGNSTFHKVLENGKATWPDESFATREMDKTFTWIKSEDPADSEFHVDGSANGTSKNGGSYEMEILETLIFKRACRRAGVHVAIAGIKSVVRGDDEATIDFGDGECDNLVTVTKNGVTEEVDLTDGRRNRRNS